MSEVDLNLVSDHDGLSLYWLKLSKDRLGTRKRKTSVRKPVCLRININGFLAQQKSFPATRQSTFNQAIGRKTSTVTDLTGGWGSDALQLCAQGYVVTIVERNPLMALLLSNAMDQLACSVWVQTNSVLTPTVIEQDAREYLVDKKSLTRNKQLEGPFNNADCLYLDPMFPPKLKSSAKAPKEMQFLQWLLGPGNDSESLLRAALSANAKRIVVKRPKHADPICLPNDPNIEMLQYSSKLVHYDVYLNHMAHANK